MAIVVNSVHVLSPDVQLDTLGLGKMVIRRTTIIDSYVDYNTGENGTKIERGDVLYTPRNIGDVTPQHWIVYETIDKKLMLYRLMRTGLVTRGLIPVLVDDLMANRYNESQIDKIIETWGML